MAQSILFPDTNPIGSPMDQVKETRRRLAVSNPQLVKDLEARFPVLTAPEGQGVIPPDPGIGGAAAGKDAVGSITDLLTNLGTQSGMKPKDIQEVARGLDGVQPAEPYGPQIFDQGGILGTGMTPLDVLAFTIGAALTSNLPQDQAIARTLQIAGLPAQFRANQRQAANDFVQQKIAQARLQMEQKRLELETQRLGASVGAEARKQQAIQRLDSGDRTPSTLIDAGASVRDALDLRAPKTSFEKDASGVGYIVDQATGQARPVTDAQGNVINFSGGAAGKSINTNDLTAFVATGGATRGPTIPPEMTVEQAGATLARKEQFSQQRLSVTMEQLGLAREKFAELPALTQKKVSGLQDLLDQVKILEGIDYGRYLGPTRGLDSTWAVRRLAPRNLTGVTDDEITFRQTLEDAKSVLLLLRTGAAMSIPEYDRLSRILPKPTDEKQNFKAGLARFRAALESSLKNTVGSSTLKKGQNPAATIEIRGYQKVEEE